MGILELLFGKDGSENVSGFLTKEEIQKLKQATKKPMSQHRKRMYKTWICRRCEHPFFYTIIRCPLCESDKIAEAEHPTLYELNGNE